MRTWVATFGGLIALAIAAAVSAQDGRRDRGADSPTTRPAADRGPERRAEPRRPGRPYRGEGRSVRPRPEGPGPDEISEPPMPEPDAGRPGDPDDPGPRPRGRFGDERMGRPMFGPGPERIERLMEFLKEHYPRMHLRLSQLQDRDPRAFHQQLNRMLPRLPELIDLVEDNPELGKLIIEEHQLEMDIREAAAKCRRLREETALAEAKKHLRELISRQFDVRQKKLQQMIAQMERELARKKELLQETAAKKAGIIDRELERRLDPDW